MEKERIIKLVKRVGVLLVVLLFVWFLILGPIIKFKSNESKMLKAAKRYFEVNQNLRPTGNRVGTVSLQTLYTKSFLKDDLEVPITNKSCSVTDSWVKVKRKDGEDKYYVYLKCGVMNSLVDHKGPEITLKGDDVISVDKGDDYIEFGVKSVKDNTDGTMSKDNVAINSKQVNTKKVGNYDVTYTAVDSFGNKTVKTRTVKVVSKLKNVVKNDTDDLGYYQGEDPANYIYFSGMLFRIIGNSGKNVKVIADQDISNINYNGIDKWLDYYYEHLSEKSKEYIVENNYCNMKLTDSKTNTVKCDSYTGKKKAYVVSTDEINKSLENKESFLKSSSVSWTANKYDNKESYTTRDNFLGEEYGKTVAKFPNKYNYGIRPVLTIKGSTLIKGGDGTSEKPYSIGDIKKARSGDYLNTRYTGEYVKYSGYLWRIIDVADDSTVKVIANNNLKSGGESVTTFYDTNSESKLYNPNQKGNIGYFINNKTSRYVKNKYFVKHEIEVPIYKNKIAYKKEVDTKRYNVTFAAPDMYEMFSAGEFLEEEMESYWFRNSSKNKNIKAAMADVGVPLNEDIGDYDQFGIRLVGHLNKNIKIVSGKGTLDNPYTITK